MWPNDNKLTIEEGIQIQQRQVEELAIILNDFALTELKAECEKRNQLPMKDGFSVFRGTDIHNFIFNLKNKVADNQE